ncbi:phage holin family protein [Variovorax terrae]|uniref:Phage holin family protein n=1 Tax=Variovorax terrae TaxID=2923278 RepID=A0A9X1VUK7_9BURK|nr:phage holin family protein [Variovorax terrae]MCJ0763617.1 phage holin family protein [Variovorax terrae]
MNLLSLLGFDAWMARLRKAAAEGASGLEDRWLLARIEWEEEKQRWHRLALLALAVLGLTIVALLALSAAVVVHFWDTPHRPAVAWGVALVWLLLWGGALVCFIRTMQRSSEAFAHTREELGRDWHSLKERL